MSSPFRSRRWLGWPGARRAGRTAAVLALLAVSHNAMAGNVLRPPGTPGAASASASAAAAAAAAQAAAVAQTNGSLRKAVDSIKAWQAMQDAARAAAQAAPGAVPNGLGVGGLQVDPGVGTDPSLWQGAALPTQTVANGRTAVTVDQTASKAILTWQTFNVGKETDLTFDQSAGGDGAKDWIVLNRVSDPSAAPSQILGSISAQGQVYVVNRNGILFGGSSQVNVSTLVASGLDFAGATIQDRNQKFLNGVLAAPGVTFGGDGLPGGAVTVEAGARLSVAPYGQLVLLGGGAPSADPSAPWVRNAGTLEAPDGQVLIASGTSIGLAAAGDLRGYGSPAVTGGGAVENAGVISTPRGNVTMVGGATLQDGLVTATTSGDARGSVYLGADGTRTTLGANSVTQILPDDSGNKVIGASALTDGGRSSIEIHGEAISLLAGSTVYAPFGKVSLLAAMAPGTAASTPDDTRVYVDAGATIDVSGLRDVDVAMEQNTIEAQLRANELKDDSLLRDNPALRGHTIWFDARLGVNPGVADVSGYYDLVERDVAQLMTRGGDVTLAANEIVTRQGSLIDLSGGSLKFRDGWVRSTQLIDDTGRRVSIENAKPGVRYVGIDGDDVVDHSRWGVTETYASPLSRARPKFEAGYVEGGSAGTLTLGLPRDPNLPVHPSPDPSPTGAYRVLEGQVATSVVVGPHQRDLPSADPTQAAAQRADPTEAWRLRPDGASLVLNRAGDVTIGGDVPALGADFGATTPLDGTKYEHVLPASWFDGHGFSNLTIASGYTDDASQTTAGTTNLAPGGHLTVGAGVTVDLGDGGRFSFTGKGAEIDGTLLAPGGRVAIETLDLPQGATLATLAPADLPTLHLGATGVIDVAGRFTNDHLDGANAPARALDGGMVSFTGSRVLLDEGSLVDVSGGGRLNATGTKLTAGKGGSITLDVSRYDKPGPDQQRTAADGQLQLGGTLSGYALGTGGSLSIVTGYDLVVGDALPQGAGDTARLFTPDFFTRGGFASYALVGERSVTVTAGTVLAPSVDTLVLGGGAGAIASGTRLDDVATRTALPPDLRAPMSLSLSTAPVRTVSGVSTTPPGYSMDLTVEQGARIEMTPGSSVRLSSSDTLSVDGVIEAPGGRIDVVGVDDSAHGLGVPSIVLGPDARLLAPGWLKEAPDATSLHRSVQAGGTINLVAPGAGGALVIDAGAVVDVSGVQGVADLLSGTDLGVGQPRYDQRVVAGDAGTVTISALGGGLLAGTLRLAPGGDAGRGGTLVVSSTAAPIDVRQHDGALVAGRLTVVADRVNESGADSLVLSALGANTTTVTRSNTIVFDGTDGDVTLRTRRSLELDAAFVGTDPLHPASVELDSSYVLLRGGPIAQPRTFEAAPLAVDLTVRGDLIDLENPVWLGCTSTDCAAGGFRTARFVSGGDIRLSDGNGGSGQGISAGLFSPGAIELDAAQVYVTSRYQDPTTVTGASGLARPANDPGFLLQSDTSITVTSNGQPAPVPLSFGERLTLRAPSIVQGGVLRAPQGEIRLETGDAPDGSVVLLPGSVTSTSLEGLTVPFGAVAVGGAFTGYDRAGQGPTKSVEIDAPTIDVKKGAVLDVSGGGDLQGYTFVAGNGGSKDILSSSSGYAILPSLGSAPAPVGGATALQDPRLKVGDSVWLQGVPGLADGYYTLLPAHYALLPGGLLVQPLGGSFASAPDTALQSDGSVIASGYRAVTGTPIMDPGYGRFRVMSQDVFEKYSTLQTYSFDAFAKDLAGEAGIVARTPGDAGTVVLNASQSLALQGTGKFGADGGGLLGNLDVSAPKIAVVDGGATAPGAGYLVLDRQSLEHFGAGSVLVGGTRSTTSAGTAVNVSATDVDVDLGGASAWTGPEILLAATGTVSIANGSSLRATGPVSGDSNPLLLSGDGALLRVSTGARVPIVRTGATGAAGDLNVGNASLAADGSLTLDGSHGVALAPGAALSGKAFDLASYRVNLGAAAPGDPGTTLGADTIARLASSADLLVRGYDSIHVYGGLALGGRDAAGAATLQHLTLDTGLVQGHPDASGAARITAGTLTLRNSGGSPLAATAGAGSLDLDVDTLSLGPGQVQLAGWSSITGRAGALEAHGAGRLAFAGDLSLATGAVRAGSGASYTVDVGGAVALTHGAGATPAPGATGLGGALTVRGASVLLDTAVAVPAGTFEATATSGALTIGSNASLDVRGEAIDFPDATRFAPGGVIRLGASSDLDVAAGATLDVSGSTRGGDAGAIFLAAGGAATIDGALHGAAAAGFAGGSFSLDAGRAATDLAALDARLDAPNQGGFDGARSIRVRSGDVAVGDVHAHDVSLRADAGQVVVSGTIDAAGTGARPDGGTIELVGGSGVTVAGTARLDAHAASTAAGNLPPASGQVTLVATGGQVDVAAGSVIDVSGGRSGGGELVVRANRDAANVVAVAELAGTIRARDVVVQGVQGYQATGGVVDATLVGQMLGDADAWLANAGAIQALRTRLGASNPTLPPLLVAPGMLVTSAGDLTIASAISLGGSRGAGWLGFETPGSLEIAASVSDGFDRATSAGAQLLGGRSFSLGFDAGGDVEIAAGALVRTGTGDVSIAAGRDVKLDDRTSVVYTAGAATSWSGSGFQGAPAGLPLGQFPTGGGDVTITAGRDVVAPAPSQTTSAWLFRYGDTTWNGDAASSTVNKQTSWSVVFDNFQQGVGALGGGDVRVSAGRDVDRLQVSIPTTGYLTTAAGSTARDGDLVVNGGGDFQLTAGRDVLGGLFMLGRGHADVRAGGRVAPDATGTVGLRTERSGNPALFGSSNPGVLFGLMDATARVTAGSAVLVEGAYDPMLQGQIAQNLGGGPGAAFSGYTERTALDVTSLGGSVTYASDPWASVDPTLSTSVSSPAFKVAMSGSGGLNQMFGSAPGTLRLASLDGSVLLRDDYSGTAKGTGTLALAPAATGTLEVLAKDDVDVQLGVQMLDTAPAYRRGPLDPFATIGNAAVLGAARPDAQTRGDVPIHAADREPVRIEALEGSVCLDTTGACVPRSALGSNLIASITVPKPLEVYAGTDILWGNYKAQNNPPPAGAPGGDASPLSQLTAGRDLYEPSFEVTGVGSAVLSAGRDVIEDLRTTSTSAAGGLVRSKGDKPTLADTNGALPHGKAADLYVVAGTSGGVDYDGFAAVYLDPGNAHHVPRTYLPELAGYMKSLGYGPMSDADLVKAFQALPQVRRAIFLDTVYFAELKATGIDYNDPSSPRHHSYQRGYDAVARLFPGDPSKLPAGEGGSVILNGKPLETWAEGDITVLAPYGRVAVGSEADTSGGGGIVTRRGGDIRIMADGNIDLFTSRVFTLQGGDITMWTTDGSITAGSGAKTSVFYEPLKYAMNTDAVVTVDAFGLQTGAGIGVLDALQDAGDRPRSRLDLIAPRGEVNAGDAGIRVVGDINIAAQVVVGVENIQVSGSAAGVPKVEVPNVGAVTSASAVAQAAAKEGVGPETQPRTTVADLPSIITVEVVGYETTDPAASHADDASPQGKKKRGQAPERGERP